MDNNLLNQIVRELIQEARNALPHENANFNGGETVSTGRRST